MLRSFQEGWSNLMLGTDRVRSDSKRLNGPESEPELSSTSEPEMLQPEFKPEIFT